MEVLDKQTFTRRELYDLVWSQSLLSLSRKYNISDVGLRKICVRMSIPLPRAGHWEKLKHGKPVSVFKLPTSYSGENEVTLALRNENDKSSSSEKVSISAVAKKLKNNKDLQLIVPERLTSPDKLVASAKLSLARKEASFGLYKGVVSSERGELSIRVTPQNVGRALRIMDTLIKALKSRQHSIEIYQECTYVVIDSQKMQISLKEKLKRIVIENPKWSWQSSEYEPAGILTFRVEGYPQIQWKDGKEPLENQLPNILARLEVEAARRKQEAEERERWWEQEREKKCLAEELKARKEKDLSDFKETLEKASRWHKATNLRNYISEVEQKALMSGGVSEELKKWLTWARQKADWYDPFTECEDIFLNDVDRESLIFTPTKSYYSW